MSAMIKEAKKLVARAHSGRAKKILKALPKLIKQEAKRGSTDVRVMELSLDDYDTQTYFLGFVEKYILNGTAKEVFDFCKASGLNPVIYFGGHSDLPSCIAIKLR